MSLKNPLICALSALTGIGWSQSLSPTDALRVAYSNRPLLKAAEQRVERARALQRSVSSLPATMLMIGRGSDRVPGADDNDLALVQPLDLFGKGKSRNARGSAEVEVAIAELKLARLDVQNEVLTRFNHVVALAKRLRIAESALELSRKLRESIKKRFEVGQIPEVQLLRATIEQDRAGGVLEDRRSALHAAMLRLEASIGGALEAAPSEFAVLEPSGVVAEHPQAALLRTELNSAERSKQLARRTIFPETQLEVRRSPWTQRQEFGLRLQMSVPIFDSGRSRSELNAMDAQVAAKANDLKDQEWRLAKELQAVSYELASAEQAVLRQAKLVSDARELAGIAERGLEAGALTLVDTLESARSLRDAEDALVDSEWRRAAASVSRLAAVGAIIEARS